MFFEWLITQCDRTDFVGRFAQRATRSKSFPRNDNKLHTLLQHFKHDKTQYELAKIVHKEYRQSRKRTVA